MIKEYYIFQKNKVLYKTGTPYPYALGQKEVDRLCSSTPPRFSFEMPHQQGSYIIELEEDIRLPQEYEMISLRTLNGWVDEEMFAAWSRAAQLNNWFRANRYCGFCGAPTVTHDKEPALFCRNCEKSHYPAISPCIIVLIHRKQEILLARSPRFRKNMYSTLAGFVEPGESAEEALHREIFEEVRLRVTNLRYFSSQSWPFPGQLMLGFFAEYLAGEIQIDGMEICDANWYEFDKLPEIPGKGTIAGQLIRHYRKSLS